MNTFDKDTFREQLTALRKERNLTQSDLSAQLGISDKTYSRWETGDSEPDMNSLAMLSEIYGVSPAVFFGKTDTKDNAVSSQLDGLEPSEMIQRAFELQFQVIRGLAKRSYYGKWWENFRSNNIQPPPNHVNKTDHSITAYANGEVYSMMFNGSDANISVSLLPNTQKYAWLTSQREGLSSYLTLLGDPDMVRCMPWLMSDKCQGYFTADYLAKNTKIPLEKATELMERATEQKIVRSTITHIGQQEKTLYWYQADHMLTAIMTLAYLSLPDQEKNGCVYVNCPVSLDIDAEVTK